MSIDYNTLNYLNLKQNDVEEVSTHSDNDNIYFNVTLKRKDCKCPNCNNLTNKVKDYKIKIIRHSIFNDGRNSFISYKQRRYFCPICKSSFIEENPFVKEKDKVSRLLIPGLSASVAAVCKEAGVPYLPGVVTPTEIMAAIDLGLTTLKFFPAGVFGGLKAIKALGTAFPAVKFMPTGGVSNENLSEFIACDKIIACGGSWVCKKTYEETVKVCLEARKIIKGE